MRAIASLNLVQPGLLILLGREVAHRQQLRSLVQHHGLQSPGEASKEDEAGDIRVRGGDPGPGRCPDYGRLAVTLGGFLLTATDAEASGGMCCAGFGFCYKGRCKKGEPGTTVRCAEHPGCH
jgi:hypothetical protein